MSIITGMTGSGYHTVQYSNGPVYSARLSYGRTKEENRFLVWRDENSTAFETGRVEDVHAVVYAWTMQAWKRPRWDVQVFANAERSGKPAWIESHWSEEEAESAKRKINAGPSMHWANVRSVPSEEYSQEKQ